MQETLLNREFIRDQLIGQDFWADSHGAIRRYDFLGTSLLYFSLCYLLPAKIAVILGSGSGFVPRLVRQAQREVYEESFLKTSRCLLIDANQNDKGFGQPDYHDRENHFFRKNYPEIEIWKMTTDAAYKKLKEDDVKINFLHIDADHTFAQSWKDFENYFSLMADDFVITLHDTAIDHIETTHDGCVARTVAFLRQQMQTNELYKDLEILNFNFRRNKKPYLFGFRLTCCGTAVIKRKHSSIWDLVYTP